MGTTQYDMFSK